MALADSSGVWQSMSRPGLQELVQLNRERIQQLTLETHTAERQTVRKAPAKKLQAAAARLAAPAIEVAAVAGRETMQNPWVPVAFSEAVRDGMSVVQHAGKHWVLFRDASGAAACIEDACAHRACPLSLVSPRTGGPEVQQST